MIVMRHAPYPRRRRSVPFVQRARNVRSVRNVRSASSVQLLPAALLLLRPTARMPSYLFCRLLTPRLPQLSRSLIPPLPPLSSLTSRLLSSSFHHYTNNHPGDSPRATLRTSRNSSPRWRKSKRSIRNIRSKPRTSRRQSENSVRKTRGSSNTRSSWWTSASAW